MPFTLPIAAIAAIAHASVGQGAGENQEPPTPPPTPPQESQGGAPQNANYFNPQMAMVFDFRARIHDPDPTMRKADFKEIEFNFFSAVDPFLNALATISLSKGPTGETVTDIEEAYAQYIGFAHGMDVRVGKMKAAIGRTNRNHTDQLEYLDFPLVIQDLFGEEGLKAPGASVAYLFPGDRFHEMTVEGLDLDEDHPVFSGSRLDNPLWVTHYRTFFDFNEDMSAQFGLTYANGPNGTPQHSQVYGADYTMKWQPGKKGKSALFEAEAYQADTGSIPVDGGTPRQKTFGAFAALTYEVKPNWFATVKADYSEIPLTANLHRAVSLGLTYKMSEFSHVRLEYQKITSNFENDRDLLTFQLQYLIGVHPAHKY